jgi:dipeptidyl aminopeptidase/acylaminoacyl peptidase
MSPFIRTVCLVLVLAPTVRAAAPDHTRTEDVVYGRRDGRDLTLDVFTPPKPNGAGVVMFVSAGYRSNRDMLAIFHPAGTKPFLDRGYIVFAAFVSSQPKHTIPEIADDAHRAVRFVRLHAKKNGIDPERVGVTGASSGGHLALLMNCAGKPGNPDATDPVERQSSRVAAAACFFPPSDLLSLEGRCPEEFQPAFDIRGATAERRREIGRDLSPLTHVSRRSGPALIIHGEKDGLVPFAQSEALIAKLKENGVPCELVARPGKPHGWLGIEKDVPLMADWFDRHLAAKPETQARMSFTTRP